jgi:hypothetical protein
VSVRAALKPGTGLVRQFRTRAPSLILVALLLLACSTYETGLLTGAVGSAAAGNGAGGSASFTSGAGGAPLAVSGAGAGAGGISNDDAGSAGVDATSGAGETSSGGATNTAGADGILGGGGSAVMTAGGAAGSGGSSPLEMIDDFEEEDGFILLSHKRNGPWYILNDDTVGGVESPFMSSPLTGANARPGSSAGLHMTATGFTGWGAGVGFDFVNEAGKKVAYDVSAYTGILFYAKIASGAEASMKVLMPTIYSDPDGGKCTGTTGPNACNDHFSYQVSPLTTAWAAYQFSFTDLVQQGFGLMQSSFDPTSVYSLQFTLTNKLAIDLWLDDIAFIKK